MEGHAAIFPSPGMGHLIPLTELAQRLLQHHHILVTFIIPTTVGATIKPQNDILNTMPENISSIFLPPVDLNDIPDDATAETRIALTMSHSFHALRETLADLVRESKRPTAFVVDVFGPPSFDIVKEFNIPPYIFCPVSAMSVISFFYTPILDKMYDCDLRDLPEPLRLPGCVPFRGSEMPEPLQRKKSEIYKQILHLLNLFSLSKGVLVNSFYELEPSAFKALEEGEWCKPDVYYVGPLIRPVSKIQTGDGIECLKWLDKQPVRSVLFVSFGSAGTLSQHQLNELAFGLEQSGQRFLWVIKSPHEKSNTSFINAQSHLDPFGFLPEGFLDRVKDRGLAVSSWAPQVEILSHGSTGGFLTHCGWNSILESVVNGVPMIAWPLFAEQRMNAVLLTDGLGVAYRVKVDEKGLVGSDEIDKCVRNLIAGEDGRKMKLKVSELKEFAAMAMSQDGSLTKSLPAVAQKWVE